MKMFDQVGSILLFVGFVACSGQRPVEHPRTEVPAPRFEPVQQGIGNFRFMVENAPNEEFVTYHVSTSLTTALIEGGESITTSPKNKALLQNLEGLVGVRDVWIRPYEVIIMKEERWSWDVVKPAVEAVIRLNLEPRQVAEVSSQRYIDAFRK